MDRRVKRTRAAVFNAVLELLIEKDIDKITVIELCKKADINKSTFYLHYNSIDDCLQKSFKYITDGIVKLAEVIDFDIMEKTPEVYVESILTEAEKYFDYIARFKESPMCASAFMTLKTDLSQAICKRNNFTVEKDYAKVAKVYFCVGGCCDGINCPLPEYNHELAKELIVRMVKK